MNATLNPIEALERATSDYLAVSRNAHLYATPALYADAESLAWDKLVQAQEDAQDPSKLIR